MYRERPSRLPGAVVWVRHAQPDGRYYRVLPDGCLDLIWTDGDLLVAGPDTGPQLGFGTPGAAYTGLRFAPGTAPAVLGIPADDLTDQRVPLESVWSAAYVGELTERLAEARHPGRVLETIARDRLARTGQPPDPVPLAVADSLRAGRSVATTAEAIGYSERQLRRRCLPAFGYGPKTLARVLRMERALTLARSGVALAAAGARAGYADQAHLTREVKALSGLTPRALLDYGASPGSDAKRSTPLPSGSRTTA